MLNTGLLLKKPEESSYARYRRFLISNHGLHRNKSSLRNALIDQISEQIKLCSSAYSKTTSLELCIKYQNIFSGNKSITASSTDTGLIDKPVYMMRNCATCAGYGYHNEIFNIPWIKKCPIHNKSLTDFCKKCKQPWPIPSELLERSCSSCGVRINLDKLIQRGAFNFDHKYNKFISIRKFFNTFNKLKQTINLIDIDQDIPIRQLVNSQTAFIPTVINITHNLKNERKILNKFGIKFYKYFRLHFYCHDVSKSAFSRPTKKGLKTKFIRKTTFKIYQALDKMAGHSHKPGECVNNTSEIEEACSECKTWAFWKYLILDEDNHEFDRHLSDKNSRSYRLNYELQAFHKSNNSLYLPKIISHIQIIDGDEENSERILRIPTNIQTLIYTIDLWSTFNHIYESFLLINDLLISGSKSLFYDQASSPALTRSENKLSCPFYISVNKNIANLTIPKSLLRVDLSYASEINQFQN